MSSPQPSAAVQNLFEAARAGNAQALEKLLETLRPLVLSTCYRMIGNLEDAEDAAQDALLGILTEMKSETQNAWQALVHRQAVSASLDFITVLREEDEQNGQSTPGARPVEPLLTDKLSLGVLETLEQNEARTMTTRASMMLVFIHVLHILPLEARAVLLLKDILGCGDEVVALALALSPEKIAKHLQAARDVVAAARGKIPGNNMLLEDVRARRVLRSLGRRLIQKDAMKIAATLAEEAVLVIPKLGSFHGQEAVAAQFANMFTIGLAPDAIAEVEINGQPGLVCFQKRLVRKRMRYLPCLVLALAISPSGAARNKIVRLDMVTELKIVKKIGRHVALLKVRALRPRR